MNNKTILITGGAGFIGSALIRSLVANTNYKIVNLDKLSYASSLSSLSSITSSERYTFIKGDICNKEIIRSIFDKFKPNIVMHLAAESHVDRSIDSPDDFLLTNIIGTANLLNEAKNFWLNTSENKNDNFLFHHISTDEVYGSIENGKLFTEASSYDPSSPYAASKASSDHLVRSWGRTYGLPYVITNCSNNYGPYQFPEKLIPLMILNAINSKPLPVYGKGNQTRDWLHVNDHVSALITVMEKGVSGETYNIGGNEERKNIEVVETICEIIDEMDNFKKNNFSHKDLITHVKDRPGHDLRYAIDSSKIQTQLGWKPKYNFKNGLADTVKWYLDNILWCEETLKDNYDFSRLGNFQKK